MDQDLRAHKALIALVRSKVERLPGQRVSRRGPGGGSRHQDLMAATELLAQAAEKERKAGNPFRASEINHLVIATFKAAIRVDDIVPDGVSS